MERIIRSLLIALLLALAAPGVVHAATNIDSTHRWAWSDVVGWIDFHGTQNVNVFDDRLEGYASASAIGNIALNCNSTPNGNTCSQVNFRVANDGSGDLSGWAWSDIIGWISFCGNSTQGSGSTGGCPVSPTPTYQVSIDPVTGIFSGWAWNDVVGWISFNSNQGGGTVPYRVQTSWAASTGGAGSSLISSVFDTCFPVSNPQNPQAPFVSPTYCTGGAALNSIMWQGSANGGTVRFQVASSDCSNGKTNFPYCDDGDGWDYDGTCAGSETCFIGADGTTAGFFENGPDTPIPVIPDGFSAFVNQRYLRYKIIIGGNGVVEDVIMNWSH